MHVAVCCSVLQCVSACCRGVGTPRVSKCKCVAVYGSGLQCLVVCCSVLQRGENSVSQSVQVCCSIWQRVVAYGSVLQCVAVCCEGQCSASRHIQACCSIWQCVEVFYARRGSWINCYGHVAVCCNVLQMNNYVYRNVSVPITDTPRSALCVSVCCSVLQSVLVAITDLPRSPLFSRTDNCFQTLGSRSFTICELLREQLQCVAVCCRGWVLRESACSSVLQFDAVRCSVLQCVAACCRVLQTVCTPRVSMFKYVAECCNVLHCVAACCSVYCRGSVLCESVCLS